MTRLHVLLAAVLSSPPSVTDVLSMQGTRSMDSSALLRRTSVVEGDRTLVSALLTEQSALHLIRTASPMFRKFAFHMAIAGQVYFLAGQHAHAVRCYSVSLTGYGKKQWDIVEVRRNGSGVAAGGRECCQLGVAVMAKFKASSRSIVCLSLILWHCVVRWR